MTALPLYFVTGNAGKFTEVQALIPEIVQLKLEIDEIQSLSSREVIEHKLYLASKQAKGRFIVEDTTLTFNCIAPLPGTLIKWFEKSLGTSGMADLVSRYSDHSATAQITIGYRDANGENFYFSATTNGEVVAPQGDNGFGWDAMFQAAGQTLTNAQLTADQKNAFSARGAATRQLVAHLQKHSTT